MLSREPLTREAKGTMYVHVTVTGGLFRGKKFPQLHEKEYFGWV